MSILALGLPGGPELFIILLVVLLVFGGRKLPELARSMGSSINQFKKGLKEDPDLLDESKEESKDEQASGEPKDRS